MTQYAWLITVVAGGIFGGCGNDPASPMPSIARGGVYKQALADSGWSDAGLSGMTILFLGGNPHLSQILFAGTNDGLYLTDNGGESWTPSPDIAVWTVAVDPQQPQLLYIGTNKGVYKSGDGGGNWSNTSLTESVWTLVIDAQQQQVLYAYSGFAVHKSDDHGQSWEEVGGFETFGGSFGTSMAIDAQESGYLYVGTLGGVYRSRNRGETWMAANDELHVNALVVDPQSNHLYAGTTTGVHRSEDRGDTWTQVGLGERSVSLLLVDPTLAQILYAVAGGVHESRDGGESWIERGNPGGILGVWSLAIDAQQTLFAGAFDPTDG